VEKAFLEKCLADGLSLEEIGKRAGKHPSTVRYWMQKYGLRPVGARHAPRSGLTRGELEPLVEEGLTIEAIARRVGVGDSTARNWLKRHGLQTRGAKRRSTLAAMRRNGERETRLDCQRHGSTKFVALGSGAESRLRCARCQSEAVARRRRKVKEILVAEAGGSCAMCGYSKHSAALQFHHVDPSTKSFGLGVRGITRSIARLREEASKCVLLCANCHAEVEAGVVELPVKSTESIAVRGGTSD
jgi:transposase